ncbi:MAG TPA: hypothetical protein VLA97_02260 [Nocardioidaceae bacterium]|nr:hypothetical protein [Nocardioidaceae bacterium]
MSRTSLRSLVVALVATPTLLMTAGPAAAAGLTVLDERNDVHKSYTDEEGSGWIAAPRQQVGDVVRMTFQHRTNRVAISAKFVDLDRRTGTMLISRMRDQSGKRHIVTVEATRRKPAGRSDLSTYRGRSLDCNVDHSISYTRNEITLSFPRRCVDNPRTLQFTAFTVVTRRKTAFVDNPHNTSPEPRGWTAEIRRG